MTIWKKSDRPALPVPAKEDLMGLANLQADSIDGRANRFVYE